MDETLKKAVETVDSEIYTLNQYLKDKDMQVLHGHRFRKMIEALSTLLDYVKKSRPFCDACGGTIPSLKNEYNCECAELALKDENIKLKKEIALLKQSLYGRKGTL